MTAPRHNLNALLPVAALACSMLLAGCPGEKPDQPAQGGKPGAAPRTVAAGEYPPAALQYLLEALKQPTEGYPALAYTWTVLAQLDQLDESKLGPQIGAEIKQQVAGFGGKPPVDLVTAWLAVRPEAAEKFIREQGKAGDWSYISAYWFHPELARPLLSDPATRLIAPRAISDKHSEVPRRWLELQAGWGVVTPADKPLLVAISEREADPANTLRAAGWILRLEPDSQRFSDYLTFGIRKIAPGQLGITMGATEGAKVSRNARIAAAFVPLASRTPLTKDKEAKTPTELHFVAYALTYLPGEQAALMRRRMLDAQDPVVRWQARLGELLHGDAKPWDAAIDQEGLSGKEWWLALERIEAGVPALLPTLRKMSDSEDASLRLRAAALLGKFGWGAADADVLALVDKLCADEVPEVRTAAWYGAARLGHGEPVAILNNDSETPEVRLAAVYAALMQGQGGTPESKWRAAAAQANAAAVADNVAPEGAPADGGQPDSTATEDNAPATEGGE